MADRTNPSLRLTFTKFGLDIDDEIFSSEVIFRCFHFNVDYREPKLDMEDPELGKHAETAKIRSYRHDVAPPGEQTTVWIHSGFVDIIKGLISSSGGEVKDPRAQLGSYYRLIIKAWKRTTWACYYASLEARK